MNRLLTRKEQHGIFSISCNLIGPDRPFDKQETLTSKNEHQIVKIRCSKPTILD